MSRRKRIPHGSRRDNLLAGQPSGISQGLADILSFQVGVDREDFLPGDAFRDQRDDQFGGYPHPADTGTATHFPGLKRDPLERLALPADIPPMAAFCIWVDNG